MGWMDDESLAWMYDVYALYGEERWPEEFDDPIKEERATQSQGEQGTGRGTGFVAFALGWVPRAVRAIASRFRREGAAGGAPMAGAEGGLALPGSRP